MFQDGMATTRQCEQWVADAALNKPIAASAITVVANSAKVLFGSAGFGVINRQTAVVAFKHLIIWALRMTDTTYEFADCPHCYHHVMYREDGCCLACSKNRHDAKNTDPSKTMVVILNYHLQPPCCFVCGQQTQRIQPLSWKSEVIPTTNPILKAMGYLPGSTRRKAHRLNMPVCEDCTKQAKQAKLLSVSVDLDCRMVVHRNYRAAFEEINGKEYVEWT